MIFLMYGRFELVKAVGDNISFSVRNKFLDYAKKL